MWVQKVLLFSKKVSPCGDELTVCMTLSIWQMAVFRSTRFKTVELLRTRLIGTKSSWGRFFFRRRMRNNSGIEFPTVTTARREHRSSRKKTNTHDVGVGLNRVLLLYHLRLRRLHLPWSVGKGSGEQEENNKKNLE